MRQEIRAVARQFHERLVQQLQVHVAAPDVDDEREPGLMAAKYVKFGSGPTPEVDAVGGKRRLQRRDDVLNAFSFDSRLSDRK